LFGACQLVADNLGVTLARLRTETAEEPRREADAIQRIAQASHIRAREVVLKSGWWKRDNGPLVGFRSETGDPVALIRRVISGSVASSIIGGLFSILNLSLLFYYSWQLALLAMLLVAISISIGLMGGYFVLSYERRQQTLGGEIAHLVLQLIQGIGKIQSSGAIRRAFVQWAGIFGRQNQLAYREAMVSNAIVTFNSVFPILASICIFAFVAFHLWDADSGFSTGHFFAFNAAFGAFLSASMQLAGTATQLINVVPLYERAKPILVATKETDRQQIDPGELSCVIEIKHLYFRYLPEQPYVLQDVSLSIRQGEFIAIVGPSGSGKSTLLRILLGFEMPERGSVYFDGRSLRHLDIRAVRRQIGVVLQNSQLIGGDIYSNIVGSTSATMEEAWAAAKMAGLDKDIQEMPMGMQTFVSEGTGAVSGGQRQRLLIARALIKRPSMLFFDEATSALDNPAQAIVSSSLEQIGATRVVVAHRLSTISNADRIYVMYQGRIVEQGSYDELMELNGQFSRLAKRQLA